MKKTKRRKSRRTRKGGMIRKAFQTLGSNALTIGSEFAKNVVKNEVFGNKYSKQYKNLNMNENVNPNITRKNVSFSSPNKNDFEI